MQNNNTINLNFLLQNLYLEEVEMNFESKYPPKSNFKPYQTHTSNFATSIPTVNGICPSSSHYKTNSNSISSNSNVQNIQSQFSQQSSQSYQSFKTQPTNQYATSIKFSEYASSSLSNFRRPASLSKENNNKIGQPSKAVYANNQNHGNSNTHGNSSTHGNSNTHSNTHSKSIINHDNLSGSRVSQFDVGCQGNYNFKHAINFNQYSTVSDYGKGFESHPLSGAFTQLQENCKTLESRQKTEKSSNGSLKKSQQNLNSINKYQNDEIKSAGTNEEKYKRELNVLSSEISFKNSILKSKDKQIQHLNMQISNLKLSYDKNSNQKSQLRVQRQQKQKIFHKMLETQGQNRTLAEKNRQLQNQLRKQRQKNYKSATSYNNFAGNEFALESSQINDLNKTIENKSKTINVLSQEKLTLQISLKEAMQKIRSQTVQYQSIKKFYKGKIEGLEATMLLLQRKIQQRKSKEKERINQQQSLQQSIKRLNQQILQKNQMIKYLQMQCKMLQMGDNQKKSNQSSRKSQAKIKNLQQQSDLSSKVIKELQIENRMLQVSKNKIQQENIILQGKVKTLAKQLTIFRTKCNEHQETIKNLEQMSQIYKKKTDKYLQQIENTNLVDKEMKNENKALQQRLSQILRDNYQLKIQNVRLLNLQAQQREKLRQYTLKEEKGKSASQLVQRLNESLVWKQKQNAQLLKQISQLKLQKTKLNQILIKTYQVNEDQESLQQEFDKMKIKASRMTEQLQSETSKLEAMSKQNKRLSLANEELSKQCQQLSRIVKRLSEESHSIGTQFSHERERLFAAQQLIATIQNQNEFHKSKIAKIQLQKIEVQRLLKQLKDQNQSQRSRVIETQSQIEYLTKCLQNIKLTQQQDSGNLALKIDDLQQNVMVFETQISKMKQDNGSLREQLQKKNSINSQLTKINGILSQNYKKIELEYTRLAEQVRDLRKEYQYISDLNMDYKGQLQSLQLNYQQQQRQKFSEKQLKAERQVQNQNQDSDVQQYYGFSLKVSKAREGDLKYSAQEVRQNRKRLKHVIQKIKEIISKKYQNELKSQIMNQLQEVLPFIIYLTTKSNQNLIPSTQQLNVNASKFLNVSMSAVFCQEYLQILQIFQVDSQLQDHHQILMTQINNFRQSIKMLVDKVNSQQYEINMLDADKHNLLGKITHLRNEIHNLKNKLRENQKLIKQLNEMLMKSQLKHFSDKIMMQEKIDSMRDIEKVEKSENYIEQEKFYQEYQAKGILQNSMDKQQEI